jgi:hypothetical protein
VSAFLSPADVERLCGGLTQPAAQRRALDRLGIRYIPARGGEPLVRPEWLDATGKAAQRSGHRWDRIGGIGAQVTPLARARR